jgi:hypothetical protein
MPLWSRNAVFPGCSSLSALTYSNLTDVPKFITLRPFIVSVSVNTRWKDKKRTAVHFSCLYSNLILVIKTVKMEICVDCTVRTEFTIVFCYC